MEKKIVSIEEKERILATKKFNKLIENLGKNIQELSNYDSFGSAAMAGVLNLMLSRNADYVNAFNEAQAAKFGDDNVEIPEDVAESVDSIIKNVQEKLKK
jgi:hypothetical protein